VQRLHHTFRKLHQVTNGCGEQRVPGNVAGIAVQPCLRVPVQRLHQQCRRARSSRVRLETGIHAGTAPRWRR
jgi:hypothetical protein